MGTGTCVLQLLGDLKHGLLHAQLLKEQLLLAHSTLVLGIGYLHLWLHHRLHYISLHLSSDIDASLIYVLNHTSTFSQLLTLLVYLVLLLRVILICTPLPYLKHWVYMNK